MDNLTTLRSSDERAIDTLTAFVRDAEHDILSVVTALQAHIDVLHDEQVRKQMPIDRFAVLNRAITRLITDTTALAAISELARTPRSEQKVVLAVLMQEIAAELRSEFTKSRVLLSCDIATGTTLIGDVGPVKTMITAMVVALLHKCHFLETVRIVGLTDHKRVTLSFDIGNQPRKGTFSRGAFEPWRLGELRLLPTNGEGISLSAVDALARLHHGQLSVTTLPNERQAYRLTFRA